MIEIHVVHSLQEALQWEHSHFEDKSEGLCVIFHNENMLQIGKPGTANVKVAEKFNLPTWQASHGGGSIICFNGDLTLYLLSTPLSSYPYDMCQIIQDYFQSLDLNVKFNNNDVLIDNHKIFSCASSTKDNMVQNLYHFSVNINFSLIQDICTKEMLKVPGALSEYNITAEDIWESIQRKIIAIDGEV